MSEAFTLGDAAEMHRKHPRQFDPPPPAVAVGQMVKLAFRWPEGGAERMWVEVTETVPALKGVLRCVPFDPRATLEHGEGLSFELRNVYEVDLPVPAPRV